MDRLNSSEGLRRLLHDFLRRRQHPIRILGYTSKTLWLLLIPAAKNFVASDLNIQGWFKTYWLEIITVIVIISWAVFRWLFVFYRIDSDSLTVHGGPFGIMRTKVFFSEITALRTEQGYLYRAVNASTLYVETQAVSLLNNEIKLVISKKSIDEIFKIVSSRSEGAPSFTVAPKRRYMLVFSLIFSSTTSGLLIFGAATFQIYRIIGGEMERRVADKLANKVNDQFTAIDSNLLGLSKTVPKAVLFVGGIIAAGWLTSFVSSLMENWAFRATRRGSQLIVGSGAVKSVRKVVERMSIGCFDMRQTLTMKLFRISSVHILCPGYSKRKKHTAAIIPITTYSEMTASLRLIAPELSRHRMQIHTAKGALRRYTIFPLMLTVVPVITGTVVKQIVPRWHSEINVFMLALTIPLLWRVVVAAYASGTTAFGIAGDTLTLNYCRIFQFHRVVIRKENISRFSILQNPFQRRNGTCSLLVCTANEVKKQHRVKGLPYDETARLLASCFTGAAGALEL